MTNVCEENSHTTGKVKTEKGGLTIHTGHDLESVSISANEMYLSILV